MNFFSILQKKIVFLFRRHILREAFLLEVSRWIKDRGDETLRLDYPLQSTSVVLDVGGYHGDFAEVINKKFGCKVYIFEPVAEFYQKCVSRFKNNKQIKCMNFGLSSIDGWLEINLAENASSFTPLTGDKNKQKVRLRSITELIKEIGVNEIDLMKLNIEGGEFDIIPAIIQSGDIRKVKYLQVQFHNFVEDAKAQRDAIRSQLSVTHTEMWNYEFVWESWKLKEECL